MRCGERRLRQLALAGIGICLALVASDASGAGAGAGRDAVVERQRYAMGTMFSVIVRTADVREGRAAADAALDAVVQLDRVLSHYDERSDLSRLVRTGTREPVVVHPDLYRVIAEALVVSRWSDGRFDISVGPLVLAWRAARDAGRHPTEGEIERVASCTGHQHIVQHPPDRIHLLRDCMALDLGAIGKGYAVDRAIDVLTARGVEHAIVNSGGSTIKAIGAARGFEGWPVRTGPLPTAEGILVLRDASLSTSEPHGETIQPLRKAPASSGHSVSVLTRNATLADALSTALVLSSVDEGRTMLGHLPETSAAWTRADGSIEATHGAGFQQDRSRATR